MSSKYCHLPARLLTGQFTWNIVLAVRKIESENRETNVLMSSQFKCHCPVFILPIR